MSLAGCPSRAELSEFVTGNLSGPLFECIADHVTRCPECEKALAAYDGLSDSLVSRLRQPAHTEAPGNSLPPEELLSALRSIRQTRSGFAALRGSSRLGKFELLEELAWIPMSPFVNSLS
jgi:anti-sigma factor RsiW